MIEQLSVNKKSLVISAIVLFMIILICGGMSVYLLEDPAIKFSTTFARATMAIRDNYDEAVDWKELFASARYGMTKDLDRFSGYVDHESFLQFEEDLSGGYFGIGISIIPHDMGLMILSVREGSPAAKMGLLNGDIIIAKDSIYLAGLYPFESVRLLKGEENTILNATVFRPATSDTLKVEILRKRIDFQHIPYGGITVDSMIYVRLLDFDAGASHDLKQLLDSLVEQSTIHLQGIILDLRNNPGGLFSEARRITEMFLEEGDFIVGTNSRSIWRNESFYVKSTGSFENFPLAILVNRGSASASEILAGSLKYSDHAVLIGDTTFGKGLVQGFVNLPDGDGIRLTISRYYFEGNRFINAIDSTGHLLSDTGTGLVPDIHYDFVEEIPFLIQLERSLLLIEFAHKHQDELVEAENNESTKLKWLSDFREYAKDRDFNYESLTTSLAKEFYESLENLSIKRLAGNAVDKSEELDDQLYFDLGNHIWFRLRQIAYERKYGTYRAYKDVIVPESELISMAASVLKEKSDR